MLTEYDLNRICELYGNSKEYVIRTSEGLINYNNITKRKQSKKNFIKELEWRLQCFNHINGEKK
jgi:hypothetical protein